ncbi:multidrug and toxin extrusion protein 1 isoform X2 [Thalassophryne amazonica]|uniref:multidrug and toxin extrusion protein 1 isoform X2 n=1 Tax=Thalassophryne amazonica TaxID=390379 RepID=UPI0014718AD4|nr:multidrug and toxin extrusion protein 1 isoform X2 [Thalassophryne amazonica]
MEKLGSLEPEAPLQGTGPVAGVSVADTAGADQDEAAPVSSRLFRCAYVRRLLPLAYREELYHVLRLTGPLLMSRILYFLLPFVITIFCGHIGNAELAGYALASAVINVSILATGYGLSVACDTLISQTYGSKNFKRVGVILQRSMLILLLFCLPCWGLLINMENLLLILHQKHEVARIAQIYLTAFVPAVPAMFLHHLQVTYLQNQGIILPQMFTAAAANIVNLAFNYILIIYLELGVNGSAISNSISQITICLLLFGYIRWKKLHQETWEGWSTECLQEWGSYMKIAVPSVFMICFEWWVWDIGGFLAGVLGEVDLAAQHVLMEAGAIAYMLPLGIHAAACVRVGNALGAGDSDRAIVTCKVSLVVTGVFSVVMGIFIASSKSVIGCIFTSDVDIVEIVSQNLTLYTFLQFFDALLCVCSGILVGSGMQKIAALSNLVSYYCVALPVGIALMFAAQLRILGLWVGLFISCVLQTALYLFLIYKLNWEKLTLKAQKHAGMMVLARSKGPSIAVLSETATSGICDGPNIESNEAAKSNGYNRVDTQDQELKADPEGSNVDARSFKGDCEQNKNISNTKPPALLSVSQLILRRGLTVMVLVLMLAICVTVHIAFPAPEPPAQNTSNFMLHWTNNSIPATSPLLDLTLTFEQPLTSEWTVAD